MNSSLPARVEKLVFNVKGSHNPSARQPICLQLMPTRSTTEVDFLNDTASHRELQTAESHVQLMLEI